MPELVIRKATRQGVKPLIGFYSESGCGKTWSSLLLARGFVGPSGRIVMGDTESGRGELYSDVLPGGYDVCPIGGSFSPKVYIDLIGKIEQSGAHIGILDSASHEWEGIDGVLDMASEIEAKSGKPGLHCWKLPKLEHQRFMLRLLQSSIPWIICLRAKHKSRQSKENGKTVIVKDEFTTPIQAEDFIFEMTAHAEIMPDHSCRLTKCSHPSLRDCFPAEPISIKTGEALARWCAAPGTSQPAKAPSAVSQLKSKLRETTERIHGWKKGMTAEDWTACKPKLQGWLTDECGIDTLIDAMTADQLGEAIAKAEGKLRAEYI